MNTPYEDSLQPYAELLLRTGVNLQPGQSLIIRAELAYAPIVRLLVAEAYKLHAAHVYIDWVDSLVQRAFLQNADLAAWDVPAYDVTRHRQMVDERWARLALVGPEFPFAFDDVNPQQTRTWSVKRARASKV